jgi:O-antigen ligase
MIPRLATLLCFVCIFYLFRTDKDINKVVSRAVWIPFLWIFFSSSRYASQWLDLGSPGGIDTEMSYSEGSPIDRNVFLLLIIAGVWVLRSRRLDWPELFRRNIWIWLFFIYAAISIFWSDDLIISFKRWVKGVGNLVMALVVLTEARPYEALAVILRHLGFILIPLSVLFIRFFPDLGRAYHMGSPMFTGVCFQKNSLGQLLIVIGAYFCWEFFIRKWKPQPTVKQLQNAVYLIILPMILWLLYMAHSATAVACMVIVLAFLLYCRLPLMVSKPKRILGYGLTGVAIFGMLNSLFDIKDKIIRMLGREPDLTDRTPVWEMVINMVDSPLIGTGYESFWSGDRLIEIWEQMGVSSGGIIQAHNGYIEIYLSLGIIGLVLLMTSIVTGLFKAQNQLLTNYDYGILRISLIVIVVINNYTEATYKPVSYYFVLLLISLLDMSYQDNPALPVVEKQTTKKMKYRYKVDKTVNNLRAAKLW